MFTRIVPFGSALGLAFALILSAPTESWSGGAAQPISAEDGIVKVKSGYPLDETIARLKQDVVAKGIMLFAEIDQARLAADAGITLRPSTLLVFGNPPLGTQFMTANPNAGLDWPVRLLVTQDASGQVWAVYTDFDWIKRRHHIADRDPQFKMAADVIASITASIAAE